MTTVDPIHPEAVALRPVRIVGDAFRVYEGTTFPRDPRAGCGRMVRELAACGMIAKSSAESYAMLDVLSDNGDIVQDYPLTRAGFRHLRNKLRFNVETREDA